MYTQETDKFTEIIDITLYKYNSIDLKIWGLVKRHTGHKSLSDNSILIRADILKSIINSRFSYTLNKIESLSGDTLHKEATSIYFINHIFKTIQNLSWVKITLNKNSNYNRLTEIDEIKTIKFSIKTIRGTLKLFNLFRVGELDSVNRLLIHAGILSDGEYFKVFKLQNLLQSLDLYISEHNSSDVMSLLNPIILKLEAFEQDNPEVLLITDINSDI
jgi:hypothetical protein